MEKTTELNSLSPPTKKCKLNTSELYENPSIENLQKIKSLLPDDAIKLIASFLELTYLYKLARTSKTIKEMILDSERRIEALKLLMPHLFDNNLFLHLINNPNDYQKLFNIISSVRFSLKKNNL